MIKCPKCGAQLRYTDTTCSACGFEFPQINDTSLPTQDIEYSRLASILIIIGGIGFLLLAITSLVSAIDERGFVSPWDFALGAFCLLAVLGCACAFFRVAFLSTVVENHAQLIRDLQLKIEQNEAAKREGIKGDVASEDS